MKQSQDDKSTTARTERAGAFVCLLFVCCGFGMGCASPYVSAPEDKQKADAVAAALQSAAGGRALQPEMPMAMPAPTPTIGRFDMVTASGFGGDPPANVKVITFRGQFSPANLETIEAARQQFEAARQPNGGKP